VEPNYTLSRHTKTQCCCRRMLCYLVRFELCISDPHLFVSGLLAVAPGVCSVVIANNLRWGGEKPVEFDDVYTSFLMWLR
jgi:hypothetical protein